MSTGPDYPGRSLITGLCVAAVWIAVFVLSILSGSRR